MASAKSTLAALGGIVVLVLVVALISLVVFLGTAVKQTVNTFGPRLTGTTVTLDDASLSPFTGRGSLEGLFIGNPEGWTGPKLAQLGRIHLDLAPTSLLGDTIHIRDLTIEQPEFVYETRLVTSNLAEVVKHIEAATGGPAPAPDTPDAEPVAPAKKFAVQHFALRDARVSVIAGGRTLELTLPELVLTDLGTPENGLTASELSLKVSQQILTQIATAATKAIADGRLNLNSAKDAVDAVGNTLKGLLGGGN
ncbi:AsmA family protein [Actomonas aquatica]|uniref:AsmA family protein n=1 Tax=Actomonas aquatica TaxID=2866162 RepID=A0ABZ1C5G7_9BACT|nr:AsmA family protein [Opitutus sp. WL0086]WRQ86642.1 AsmA family protein [Opitutus sp. WL0086]